MDGANHERVVGIARPGDFGVDVNGISICTRPFRHPTAVAAGLGTGGRQGAPDSFLPKPRLEEIRRPSDMELRPAAVDRTRARLLRNIGMHVRALAYIMAHGGRDFAMPPWHAVLNAVISELLEPYTICPLMHPPCMSAFSAMNGRPSAAFAPRYRQASDRFYGISILIPSAFTDRPRAMMIEPTETEAKPSSTCSWTLSFPSPRKWKQSGNGAEGSPQYAH